MKRSIVGIALLVLLIPTIAGANQVRFRGYLDNSIGIKLGYFMPNGKSDLWDYNAEYLTMSVEDFNRTSVGIELNFGVNNYLDIGIGVDFYRGSIPTEYRDWTDEFGYPIEQTISLRIVPLTFTAKILPLGRWRVPGPRERRTLNSVIPYVGGGVGLYFWRYEEVGDYIDFYDMTIYTTFFLSKGTDVGFHLLGGVEIPIGSNWSVTAEMRYNIIKGPLSADFVGFEEFDLGGITASGGFLFRF